MVGPGQPQTCSHPINAQMLTGVCQVVRMFSLCQCIHVYVYVSIGTLESDLLSQNTPCGTKCMDISLFIKALQHKC